MNRLLVAALLLLAPAAAGCGGAEESEPPGPENEPTESVSTNLKQEPKIAIPDQPPPSGLETEDIVDGKGKAAQPGDTLEVEYAGVAYSTGEEFDSSFERKQPFRFELGAGMVIPGWDQGLEGMKVGGRRQLTIPPELAYGPNGSPPLIGPDETLVFVIDLVDVR